MKKILELNFKELVRVKPAEGGGGQVKVRKWLKCESVTSREVHIVHFSVPEMCGKWQRMILKILVKRDIELHWNEGSGEQLDDISWKRI